MPCLDLRHGRPDLGGGMTLDEQSRAWVEAGAQWVQVVDVDAARGGGNQWPALARVLARGLQVQFGGGVRSMLQVQKLLDLGVQRVLVGTQAVRNPLWARELCLVFPRRVVLALDVRGDDVLLDGRASPAGASASATARALDDAGFAGIQLTELDGDDHPPTAARKGRVADLRRNAPRTPLQVQTPKADDLDWLAGEGVQAAVLAPGTPVPHPDTFRRHEGQA